MCAKLPTARISPCTRYQINTGSPQWCKPQRISTLSNQWALRLERRSRVQPRPPGQTGVRGMARSNLTIVQIFWRTKRLWTRNNHLAILRDSAWIQHFSTERVGSLRRICTRTEWGRSTGINSTSRSPSTSPRLRLLRAACVRLRQCMT